MDPRAEHTRTALHRAVLELAALRPIADIPVTELVARAGVNRSSFYQHFADREELLADALESLETSAARVSEPIRANGLNTPPAELLRFTKHFADHADLYRQALGAHGSARVANRVRGRTIALVREGIELAETRRQPALPLEVEAAGTAGAIMGIIECWLETQPAPTHTTVAGWIWEVLAGPQDPTSGDASLA